MLENEIEVVVPLSYIEKLIRENQELKDKLIAPNPFVNMSVVNKDIDIKKIADELSKKINKEINRKW